MCVYIVLKKISAPSFQTKNRRMDTFWKHKQQNVSVRQAAVLNTTPQKKTAYQQDRQNIGTQTEEVFKAASGNIENL